MSDRNDSYSDLQRAADLSRSLHDGGAPAPDQHDYASLERAPTSQSQAPAPRPAPLLPHQAPDVLRVPSRAAQTPAPGSGPLEAARRPPVSSAYGSLAWDRFLDGCMRLGNATGGFVLDRRGLAIALRGDLPGSAAESLGSRLVVAMDQLEGEMQLGAPEHPCIAVSVPGGWLSAATVAGGELAIGLLAPSSLGAEVWALIHDSASEMLAVRGG